MIWRLFSLPVIDYRTNKDYLTVGIFIHMRKNLQRVLKKIVVPMNDRLVDVFVSEKGLRGRMYIITYIINDRIDFSDGYKIEKETRSLFHMLSPNKDEDFMIQYKMIDDFELVHI